MTEEQPKIGSQLRIKLPDYMPPKEPIDIIGSMSIGVKPISLDDISKIFISSNTAGLFAKNIMKEDMFFYGVTPATRWQKFKYKFRRIKDAWDVLRGNKDVE